MCLKCLRHLKSSSVFLRFSFLLEWVKRMSKMQAVSAWELFAF